MFQDIADRLLERYCAGECTPAEQAEVERWRATDPARDEYLALLMVAWHEVGATVKPAERPDRYAAWELVQRRVQVRGELSRPIAPVPSVAGSQPGFWRRFMGNTGVRAAAAVLTLAAGAALWMTYAGDRPSMVSQAPLGPVREVVTHRRQRTALDLPDGSRVILGAESRLRIPVSYRSAVGPRELYLEGEAYFEVTHDRRRSFLVHAANGVVEDLGTAFVVTAYPETKGVEVVVTEGAVTLRTASTVSARPRALLTLSRGQLGRLDSLGTATLTREVAVAPYVAWTTGSLVFDNTPMRDVLPRLARWYDLDIQLADSGIAARRFTSTFRDETARQMLESLALSLDLRVEQVGRRVTLNWRSGNGKSSDQHTQGTRP